MDILAIEAKVLLPGFVAAITAPAGFTRDRPVNSQLVIACVNSPTCLSPSKSSDSEAEARDLACIATIVKSSPTDAGDSVLVIRGTDRCLITSCAVNQSFAAGSMYSGEVRVLKPSRPFPDPELAVDYEDIKSGLFDISQNVLKSLRHLPDSVLERMSRLFQSLSVDRLTDMFANLLDFKWEDKQRLLNEVEVAGRAVLLLQLYRAQSSTLQTGALVKSLQKSPKSAKFGGGRSEESDEISELERAITDAGLPPASWKIANAELARLKRMSPSQPEYTVSRTYLDWLIALPWSKFSTDSLTVEEARRQLDADHFGLEPVKKRILQYLAVRKLRNDLKGPILCLVGPPGVGKTSLGKSIAAAFGRKFCRVSLGGVRDVSDIKGHRRTYIGSMPGQIINALKSVQTNNPVMLLDEIDKVGRDIIRGDPASALLEVLDPEQNGQFVDHYINTAFDLSNVLFICTANDLETISAPLLDRMEIINIPGYTIYEKAVIATNHLLPKQSSEHGIPLNALHIGRELMLDIVSSYTREPGVRSLEREIAALCRHVAVELEKTPSSDRESFRFEVTATNLEKILGPAKYEPDLMERLSKAGVVCGLSYSSSGSGSVLFIETACFNGTGKVHLTGKLGDVIKESVMTACSFIRSHLSDLKLESLNLDKKDLHVHFPAGAISKDGPSAGVAILCALISLFTNTPCRTDTAMTGEMTLTGTVLPVGGIREKLLAAHRFGIKRVLIPDRNRRDVIADIRESIRTDLEIIGVKSAEDVLAHVFGFKLTRHHGQVAVKKEDLISLLARL